MELDEDFLYYGKGNISNEDNIGVFTGYSLPDPLQIPGQAMWFIFVSDESSDFRGFSLTWGTSGETLVVQLDPIKGYTLTKLSFYF